MFGKLWKLALAAILIGAATCWMVGYTLIRPDNHPVAVPAGFTAQRVSISGSGHMIAGWWIDDRPEANEPVVLLVHGIRADRSAMASRARLLRAQGFSVLLIDLQAHGETPGDAITLGWLESKDVEASIAWVKARFPTRRIGAIGTSLGGASILLAHQPIGLDAIVLEAVFPHVERAVENRVRERVGPLSLLFSPIVLAQITWRLHVRARDLAPIDYIERVAAPILIVAGSRDRNTTLYESEDLYHAASQPKDMWIVEGAGHQDFLAFDTTGYEAHVVHFLQQCLAPVS